MKKVIYHFAMLPILCLFAASHAHAATIQQTVQFNGVTPECLYETYVSANYHATFTGAPAVIDGREGGSISAYGGGATGKFLKLVPGRVIVQSWRARSFQTEAIDTTLILTFLKNDDGAEIQMVQANVPDEKFALFNTGWNTNYWEPLREYLKTSAEKPKPKSCTPNSAS